MGRPSLRIDITSRDQKELAKLLSGGVQQVRVVLRALALQQLAKGTSAPRIHYTPTHGSWLNQAEIEIGLFSRQCLGQRRIPDLKTLRRESRAWDGRMNRDRIKINWKFDRRTARRKFRYTKTSFKRS